MTELGHTFKKIDWDCSEILFERFQSPQFRIVWESDETYGNGTSSPEGCLIVLIRKGNKNWATTAWLFKEAREILTFLITANNRQEAVDLAAVMQS